jgi:hypothetical protein
LSAAPRVPRVRPTKGAPARAALPVPPDPQARADDQAARATLPRAPAGRVPRVRQVRPADEAWASLAAPISKGEGIRVVSLGVSGAGKTTGIDAFLCWLIANGLVKVVLIHDVKLPRVQYTHTDDEIIFEADELRGDQALATMKFPARRILRRRDVTHVPSVEAAAAYTNEASFNGVPTLLVIDEFNRALTDGGLKIAAPSVGVLLYEGRALGGSLVVGTQLPQRTPVDAFDMSRILLFKLGRKSLGYLVRTNVIDEATADVVASLEVGQFVIVSSEDDFDGIVYQVPAPKPVRREHS